MHHRRRRRAGVGVGLLAVLALGGLLAARPADAAAADPTVAAERRATMRAAATSADAALAVYESRLLAVRGAARSGAARVIDGDAAPAARLEEAAAGLETSGDEASLASEELAGLRGMLQALQAGVHLPDVPSAAELVSIAGQLRLAAEAAGPFVERRLAARRTLEQLELALAALDRNDPATAIMQLDRAREEIAVVAGWDPAPVTLPLWLDTTGRLIAAAHAMAAAALAGDQQALDAAAAEFAAAAGEARRADVSLALTLSEVGAGLTDTPMRRLADALAAIAQARAVLASLLQSSS